MQRQTAARLRGSLEVVLGDHLEPISAVQGNLSTDNGAAFKGYKVSIRVAPGRAAQPDSASLFLRRRLRIASPEFRENFAGILFSLELGKLR